MLLGWVGLGQKIWTHVHLCPVVYFTNRLAKFAVKFWDQLLERGKACLYRYGYGCFAFGLSGDNRSALSGNEAVLGPIEGVLGEEVISQYKQIARLRSCRHFVVAKIHRLTATKLHHLETSIESGRPKWRHHKPITDANVSGRRTDTFRCRYAV